MGLISSALVSSLINSLVLFSSPSRISSIGRDLDPVSDVRTPLLVWRVGVKTSAIPLTFLLRVLGVGRLNGRRIANDGHRVGELELKQWEIRTRFTYGHSGRLCIVSTDRMTAPESPA